MPRRAVTTAGGSGPGRLMSGVYTSTQHLKMRQLLLRPGAVCAHCGSPDPTIVDHQPPLTLHTHVDGSGCCVGVPSCKPCSDSQGGALAWAGKRGLAVVEVPDPAGFGPGEACWDVPWLDDLRDVPDEGAWPRLMSPPHAAAVGSYGPAAVRWVAEHEGTAFYWWQRLALTRLLEHDTDGRLVWLEVLLSTARQVGKSTLLRGGGLWRLHQADLFAETQTVVHTGKDVAVCKEVIGPAQRWAKEQGDGYRTRHVNGQEELEHLGSLSRWIVRARGAVYGYSASWAVVDEAWGVRSDVVEDGLEPTMVERRSPQLILASTAHRKATPLFPERRAAALSDLAAPGDSLIVEWSARRDADIADRGAWREASPYWSPGRERHLENRLGRVRGGETVDADEVDPVESFRAQFLNVWPAVVVPGGPGEPLVDERRWAELEQRDPGGHGRMWVAVEDNFGRGAALAVVAAMSDGRWEVDGRLHTTIDDAFAQADEIGPAVLIVGASLGKRRPRADLAGAAETRHGLPLLREMAERGMVVHDRSPALDEQMLTVRVRELAGGGLAVIPGRRSDLLRALCWALRAAVTPAPVPAVH